MASVRAYGIWQVSIEKLDQRQLSVSPNYLSVSRCGQCFVNRCDHHFFFLLDDRIYGTMMVLYVPPGCGHRGLTQTVYGSFLSAYHMVI